MNIDFELRGVKLTGTTKKVCEELTAYACRMRELHRQPVFRVKVADLVAMRAFAKKNMRPTDTLDKLRLDGQEVIGYDGQ